MGEVEQRELGSLKNRKESKMGPYCNFCGRRCFCHFPNETPKHILDAYGTASIIATCRAGQEFERSKIVYCYDDIMEQIRAAELLRAPVQSEQPCPTCNGYGTLLDEEAAAHGICPDCNGTGSANRSDGG